MTYIEENDFKETVMFFLTGVLSGLLILGVVVFAIDTVRGLKDTGDCVSKYGSGWEYRMQKYSADICINQQGEARYL